MRKLKIPEGMLEASTEGVKNLWDAQPSAWNPSHCKKAIAEAAVWAALNWQRENPPVPTDEQMLALQDSFRRIPEPGEKQMLIAIQWVRIMYDEPEPDVPEEIKDLLWGGGKHDESFIKVERRKVDADILEAYRRGQKKREE